MKKHKKSIAQNCPCGSDTTYEYCCLQWHEGDQYLKAPDAESLMRSRYTAYALHLNSYILATWHPKTRPQTLDDTEPQIKWIGLTIHRYEQQSDNHATVEFIARYTINGKAQRMHELSTFEKIQGQWYYKDGEVSSH